MNSKQINQNKGTNNSQEFLTKEDLDIRLARQIQLYSQALSKFKIQAHYHENVSHFINQLRKTLDSLKNNSIHTKSTSFANPQTKLKQLIIQAATNNHPNFNSKKLKQSKITRQNKRGREGIQSDHLKEILDTKSIIDQQRQIDNLADRLYQLYEKIGEEMKQDYLCEKVMIKIRKQSSIRANFQCLSQVQKQIKKYQSWKREKQHAIKLQNIKKGVQDKLLHNLEHMKNIMNKKINNNDYIYQSLQSANSQNLQRILTTFVRQNQLNRQTYQQHLTNSLADKAKNAPVQQYQKLIFNIQKVESYFREVDSTITLIESYDLQYLEKENCLRTRMQEISRRQCGYKQ